jgi:hypothetical protein
MLMPMHLTHILISGEILSNLIFDIWYDSIYF